MKKDGPTEDRQAEAADMGNDSSDDFRLLALAGTIEKSQNQARARFQRLHKEWVEQRNAYSSQPMEWASCMPYQKIIGMGWLAVPLILGELKRDSDHWFLALHAITEENPVSKDHEGNLEEMAKDWVQWGQSHGHV